MSGRGATAPARLVRIALVAVAAAVLGWHALRAAAVRMLPAGTPALEAIAPDAADPLLDRATALAAVGRADLRPAAIGAIGRAAVARPLDDRPFFLAGVRALAAGQEARGLALLEEARRRNPRQRIARLLLLDRWLRRGEAGKAATEMTVLTRLLPGAGELLVTELARLADAPATARTTRAALAEDPALLDRVLAAMAKGGASPAALTRFAGSGAPAGLEPGGWRRALVDALVARGAFADARAVWADAYRLSPAERAQPVFDPGFSGRAAGPPFGWTLSAGAVGAATIGKGALGVEYYGRQTGELAAQLLVLAPGRYRLAATIEGLDGGDGSSLGWTVACAGDRGAALLATPPIRIAPTPRTMVTALAVPAAGCGAQWLRLVGTAGEFAAPLSARIRALRVTPEP
jgi:hypothetical protein